MNVDWRRIFIRRAIITVLAIAVTVLGAVQHDGLLIGFGAAGLATSVALWALLLWSRHSAQKR